jgi:hypothetical protein
VSVTGTETQVTRTNWTERTITNQIEVRMPRNVFVNEYRTNWIERTLTNVIPVHATNIVVKTVTNRMVVNVAHTNFVTACSTNWQTLNITNWQTVLVLKTNWITQRLTNVAEIELSSTRIASPQTAPPKGTLPANATRAGMPLPLPIVPSKDPLSLEAVMTSPPSANNPAEVQLNVRWAVNGEDPLEVRQWRVQRADETVLCFGQDRQFSRELPAGEYFVEVKAQRDGTSPLLVAQGLLRVTSRIAVIQQIPVATKPGSANPTR